MKKALYIIGGILCVLGIVFLMSDCIGGETRYFECYATGHQYKAPWTETDITVDDKGNVSVDTYHHPEEYHVFCDESQGENHFDCETSATLYHSITNGQPVTVKTRVGRYTGIKWLPTIEE